MAVEVQARRFTVEEYEDLIERGFFHPDERLELIEGEIVTMNPIGLRHAAIVDRLTNLFPRLFGDVGLVSVQNPVVLDTLSEPQPDVVLLRPRADDYEARRPGPPDVLVLVEVSDTTIRHDRRKLALYARNGVPEAWIVAVAADPTSDLIHVYTDPTADSYRQSRAYRRGESLALAAFPDRPFTVEQILGPYPLPPV